MSVQVLLSGATGVIGRTVSQLAEADPDLVISATASRERFFSDDDAGDVVVDFSHPELALRSLEFAEALGLPMVIGTTGFDAEGLERIARAAERIAICHAANFSPGVNLLLELAARAAAALDETYDIEISEIHHRRKIDAPSGTALALGEAVAKARGLDGRESAVLDRSGRRQARNSGEIGYQAVRGGDVPGEHTVYFLGDAERLELTHRSADRTIFARGALVAARKIVGRGPGMVEFGELVLVR